MAFPNVTLPEADKAWLERHASERGFASADDYAAHLIAQQRASQWRTEIEAERQAGIRAHIDEGWRQSEDGEFVEPAAAIEEIRLRSAEFRSKRRIRIA